MHKYTQIMCDKYANICENMDSICKYMQIYVKICTQNMQLYVKLCNLYAFICQNIPIKFANMCQNMDLICINMQNMLKTMHKYAKKYAQYVKYVKICRYMQKYRLQAYKYLKLFNM